MLRNIILFIISMPIVYYFGWASSIQYYSSSEYLKLNPIESDYSTKSYNNRNSNLGNVVLIQPNLSPLDFYNSAKFYEKLDRAISASMKNGYIQKRTTLVFPEHIGTFLFLIGEKKEVYESQNLELIMKNISNRNLLSYFYYYLYSKTTNKKTETVLRLKSKTMIEAYYNTFSKLSSLYNVSILAGSIILPNPNIFEGKITISNGELSNSFFLFNSDGTVNSIIEKKIYSTNLDLNNLDWKEPILSINEDRKTEITWLNNPINEKTYFAVQIYLKGKLFDSKLDVPSYIFTKNSQKENLNETQSMLINYWIE